MNPFHLIYEKQDEKGWVNPFHLVYERQDEKEWGNPFLSMKDKMKRDKFPLGSALSILSTTDKMKRDGSACPLHLVYERQDEKGRVPPPLHLIYERQDEKRWVPPFPSCNMIDQMERDAKQIPITTCGQCLSYRYGYQITVWL